MSQQLFRVAPYHYIHVLDNNTNVTRVVCGPTTFTKQDHEKLVYGPEAMVVVPSRHYCTIKHPALRDEKTGEPQLNKHGEIILRHGDKEIRFAEDWQEPFPLLPGEQLLGDVQMLPLVLANTALRLVALLDFTNGDITRVAGDEWLFTGPGTYRPRVEVEIVEQMKATTIVQDHALKLRAKRGFTDRDGVSRKAGAEWLLREKGAFLCSVDEEVVELVAPMRLTQTKALQLRALETFTDVHGISRKAGTEWLVTSSDAELHIPDVFETVVGTVDITVLTAHQYCVVLDPVGPNGNNQFGARQLRVGPASFFLLPGERLEGGRPKNRYVLGAQEALLLKATEVFDDASVDAKKPVRRTPGDLWMIRGPCQYVPPVQVEVLDTRRSIPLDENEGIYVRDIKTGKVRTVTGETYMLESFEELWEKELPAQVEKLLAWSYYKGLGAKKTKTPARDKTRVVTFRVPHGAALQIYDYKTKKPRVVFGPGLVMLAPDEQFTVLSLSGDKPKRPNVIKSLAMMLGPDFMTDIVEVETSDHARLRLQLSYNWQFQVTAPTPGDSKEARESQEKAAVIFQVRDFVGDACKAIASRVRGAVATNTFDEFHKNSARIIRVAVFGTDPTTGKVRDNFIFNSNKLVITNIDIQSVEPVDEHTRESLQKSVQLAIEITTRKLQKKAQFAADETQQNAKGAIERQKILNQTNAENERQLLVALQAQTAAVISAGTATAEAEARAEYLEIEVKSDVEQAKLSTEAENILARSALQEETDLQKAQFQHEAAMAELELKKQQALGDIETAKFKQLVDAITPQTIKAIARAGPEMQARLLKGLGLKGYLLTDGNSPVNLFNTAKGMVGAGDGGQFGM